MIPQETISSPCKELKVESNCFLVSIWHNLVFCVNSSLVGGWGPMFFAERPPNLPFFQDSRNMWRFFFPKTYDKLRVWGRHLTPDPWPYRLTTLTTCCWVREKKNLTPQEMEGLGSWSFFCPLEHRFPKLPTIGWSWPSIVGRSSYQNSRWQWLQLRPFCFFPFEDWNCRNMTV